MADEPNNAAATTETPMTSAQPNTAEARTETGELKDQQTTQSQGVPDKVTDKTDTSTPSAKDGVTTDKAGTKDANAAAVPEKYEFKPAEGRELDTKFLEAATPVLKELGLTQAQADKLYGLYQAKADEVAGASHKAFQDMQAEWKDKAVKDPTLGNGNEIKPEVLKNISTALDNIGNVEMRNEFTKIMTYTGAGNNPTVLAVMNKLGALLSEGTGVRGGGPSPAGQRDPSKGPVSAAQALYPNLKSGA